MIKSVRHCEARSDAAIHVFGGLDRRAALAMTVFHATRLARLLITVAVCFVPAAVRVASAQERERGGKEIVETVCAVCHSTGVSGAPKIGDRKAWAQLTSKSLTSLTGAALKGVRRMPPHGGNPALTDTEIERAITYMRSEERRVG